MELFSATLQQSYGCKSEGVKPLFAYCLNNHFTAAESVKGLDMRLERAEA